MRNGLRDAEQIADVVSRASSIDELSRSLKQMRDWYGFANIAYLAVHLPQAMKPNPLVLVTYDRDWVCRYTERNYFRIDPVVAMAIRASLPVDWSTVDHESAEAKRIFTEADAFGVGRNGVTIPIRGMGGERALLSITSNHSSREWRASCAKVLREFYYIAHLVHDRAVRLSGLRAGDIPHSLSPRELQCVTLSARGQTPKQVAASLRISDSAVRLYLKCARLKLGCATITQAIAKAVRLEIV